MTPDEKLASKWLERIESYHRRVEGDPSRWEVHVAAKFDDCGNCGQAFPCDVVKLARALDDCIERMKRARAILHKDKNSEWLMLKPDEHERTLREVAGGSDD